ncbi:MAG: hypothetical protein ABMA15_15550 [Vicinamibacterales bacterium]
MTRPTTPAQWLPWIGTALAVLSFAWSVVDDWYDLRQRVALLEQQQKFSHGDLRPFLEDR